MDNGDLKRRVTVAEAEASNMILNERLGPTPVPFGFIHHIWTQQILNMMQPGDELWEFRNDDHYWENLAGREGIALVRNGEVVGQIITTMN